MSDMGFFFGTQHPGTQVFYAQTAIGATQNWQVWDKPRGCSMVYMLAIGGGGGGGGGFTGVATSARGGGGGGGSSNRVTSISPAMFLPDRLYVQVAKGGAGSTGSGVVGTAGLNSVICPYQDSAGNTVGFLARGIAGSGGGAGTAAAIGAGGSGGSAGQQNGIAANGAIFVVCSALSGANGGAVAGGAGQAVTVGNSQSGLSGGSGGGGTTSADFAGGAQTSSNTSWIPSVAGAAAGSNRGPDGYWSWGPQFVGGLGGAGGGASNSGVGGAGGNGAYGCGGGGGGGGTTGGGGGNGGDGLVIIVAI